ncbi:hypothetical protein [Corynebacterium mayonis]|uniref:hypothetical protein n=1 Tax=Corynebacterium mayonis TaxID=3062461 RepID=UPI003140AF10
MAPFSALIDRLEAQSERLRTQFFDELLAEIPHAAGMFPAGASAVAPALLDSLTYLLANSFDGDLTAELRTKLRGAARDLRRFGFPAETYETFADILKKLLAEPDAAALIDATAALMSAEASAADYAGIPPATAARVGHVDARGTDARIKVIRLEAGMELNYAPGQFIPVLDPATPGVWTNLVPACPANPYGQLEFHVDNTIDPAPGSYLTLGAARGPVVELSGQERVLIVALETGAATAKALVFDLLERDKRPEVDLLLHAQNRRDHYDFSTFHAVAQHHDWLNLHRAPLGSDIPRELCEGSSVVVCGPRQRAEAAAANVRSAGVRVDVLSPDQSLGLGQDYC